MATSTVNPPFLDRTSIEPQELFDFAVRALHAMPHRASAPGATNSCLYRTGDPSCPACIAGQLMTDDEIKVSPEVQGRDFSDTLSEDGPYYPFKDVENFDDAPSPDFDTLAGYGLVPARLRPHADLIVELQEIHDQSDNWIEGRVKMAARLRRLAGEYELSFAVVDELWLEARA